jgi:hypothetical protein
LGWRVRADEDIFIDVEREVAVADDAAGGGGGGVGATKD